MRVKFIGIVLASLLCGSQSVFAQWSYEELNIESLSGTTWRISFTTDLIDANGQVIEGLDAALPPIPISDTPNISGTFYTWASDDLGNLPMSAVFQWIGPPGGLTIPIGETLNVGIQVELPDRTTTPRKGYSAAGNVMLFDKDGVPLLETDTLYGSMTITEYAIDEEEVSHVRRIASGFIMMERVE